MLTIAICDDDNNQVNGLKKMLTEWNGGSLIREYSSAEQFLFNYPDVSCFAIKPPVPLEEKSQE